MKTVTIMATLLSVLALTGLLSFRCIHVTGVRAESLAPEVKIHLLNMDSKTEDRLNRLLNKVDNHCDIPSGVDINILAPSKDRNLSNGFGVNADAGPKIFGVYVLRIFPLGLKQPDDALELTLIHELEHVKLFEEGLGSENWNSCHEHLHEALARKAEIRYARHIGTLQTKPWLIEAYHYRKTEADIFCIQQEDVTPFMARLLES